MEVKAATEVVKSLEEQVELLSKEVSELDQELGLPLDRAAFLEKELKGVEQQRDALYDLLQAAFLRGRPVDRGLFLKAKKILARL